MSGHKVHRTIGFLGVLAVMLLALPAPKAGSSPLKRLHTVTVKAGYIDANFAVSPNGKLMSFLHVGEGTRPTFLEVYDLGASPPRRTVRVEVTKLTVDPVGLRFTPDSQRLLLMAEMAGQGTERPKEAFVFDVSGRQLGKIGPFGELAFRKTPKGTEIVTYFRSAQGPRMNHDISLHNVTTLRRTDTARIVSTPDGEVAKPPMQIAFFSPDFSQIVVKVSGAYDRKSDVRLPDREKVYDPFTKAFSSDREISNLADWAILQRIRAAHQRVPTLLMLSGTQKAPSWEMITTTHTRVTLPEPNPPLKQFDFTSLAQQNTDDTTVPFGLIVDPQWPALFGDMRTAAETFHLFLLDPAMRKIKLIGTIESPKQMIRWRLGGNRLAVMRLHRNWRLGDRSLEIYEVPSAR